MSIIFTCVYYHTINSIYHCVSSFLIHNGTSGPALFYAGYTQKRWWDSLMGHFLRGTFLESGNQTEFNNGTFKNCPNMTKWAIAHLHADFQFLNYHATSPPNQYLFLSHQGALIYFCPIKEHSFTKKVKIHVPWWDFKIPHTLMGPKCPNMECATNLTCFDGTFKSHYSTCINLKEVCRERCCIMGPNCPIMKYIARSLALMGFLCPIMECATFWKSSVRTDTPKWDTSVPL